MEVSNTWPLDTIWRAESTARLKQKPTEEEQEASERPTQLRDLSFVWRSCLSVCVAQTARKGHCLRQSRAPGQLASSCTWLPLSSWALQSGGSLLEFTRGASAAPICVRPAAFRCSPLGLAALRLHWWLLGGCLVAAWWLHQSLGAARGRSLSFGSTAKRDQLNGWKKRWPRKGRTAIKVPRAFHFLTKL